MKRRTFILTGLGTAALAGIGLGIPIYRHFHHTHFDTGDPCTTPMELGSFCDEATLKAIGKAYCKAYPAEANPTQLKQLILGDFPKASVQDDYTRFNFILDKVHHDFASEQEVILEGWVLSRTEARQCALLSLT